MEQIESPLVRFAEQSNSDEVCVDIAERLGVIGKRLITDPAERLRIDFAALDIDEALDRAWTTIARSMDVHSDSAEKASDEAIIAVAVSLARLCRNALAGVNETKALIMSCEPAIREVAFRVTSYDRIDDVKLFPLQRALYQLLANLVAPISGAPGSPELTRLWSVYTDGTRENDIVSRALDSKDPQTNMATLVLILHTALRQIGTSRGKSILEDPHLSLAKALFADRPAGPGLMTKLMDKMTLWFEAGEETKEHECFDLGYRVISKILDHGGHGEIYQMLASSTNPITPAQITFLKLLDAWIEAGNLDQQDDLARSTSPYPTSFHFLIASDYAYSRYTIPAMQRMTAAATSSSSSDGGDPLLPQVLQASILTTQALVNLALREVKLGDERARSGVVPSHEAALPLVHFMRASSDRDVGFLEMLIGYLRALEAFIPRVKPFRPPPKSTAGLAAPPPAAIVQGSTSFLPFATLKRDLVQLIGILVHDDKEMQDRTRECGGVELILSMCVTDEANPYIREHALFAVRNLMTGNTDNQARIAEMEPLGVVGEDGELREMPARMGVKKAA